MSEVFGNRVIDGSNAFFHFSKSNPYLTFDLNASKQLQFIFVDLGHLFARRLTQIAENNRKSSIWGGSMNNPALGKSTYFGMNCKML